MVEGGGGEGGQGSMWNGRNGWLVEGLDLN